MSYMKKVILAICLLHAVTLGFAQSENYLKKSSADWAQYGVFEKANAEVATPPLMVLMGDSITELWAKYDPDFFRCWNFAGRGISGQTTQQMLSRFREDVIDLHPKYVALMAGTNDIAMNNGHISLERIMGNLQSMCELALHNGIKVLLCSVTPCGRYSWIPEVKPAESIPILNSMIRNYADATKGVEYVDYFPILDDGDNCMKPQYSKDGCHPLLEGYKLMEEVLLQALGEKEKSVRKALERR